MQAYYRKYPPRKIRLGSDWQIYTWLLFFHWFTVLALVILLAAALSLGVIPRSEQFQEMYKTSVGGVAAQAVFDWEMVPFTAISIQGEECQENFLQLFKNPRPPFTICAL